jgi:hypothetical protein
LISSPITSLEVAHDHGIGVRADHRANEIVRGRDVGDPVAQGLALRIFERLGAAGDWVHRRSQQLHSLDVHLLALDVARPHVDLRMQPKHRAGHSDGYAMRSRSRLRNHALLPHRTRQQRLAEGIVEGMGAAVH